MVLYCGLLYPDTSFGIIEFCVECKLSAIINSEYCSEVFTQVYKTIIKHFSDLSFFL